ncbi:MAG: hypothetical protein HY774_24340 [Acidobacteria bacterium]|nr:hypothetical protein [Acidobacteriota bacterium]
MFWRKKKSTVSDEVLDRVSTEVLQALREGSPELDSLNLQYGQLRARIAEVKRQRQQSFFDFAAILTLAPRALTVMALITVFAMSAKFLVKPQGNVLSQTELVQAEQTFEENVVPVTAPVTACSISTNPQCVVSTGDVWTLLMRQDTPLPNR